MRGFERVCVIWVGGQLAKFLAHSLDVHLLPTRMTHTRFELGTLTLWVIGSIRVATEPTVWTEASRRLASASLKTGTPSRAGCLAT
jgi:hypothetical protein